MPSRQDSTLAVGALFARVAQLACLATAATLSACGGGGEGGTLAAPAPAPVAGTPAPSPSAPTPPAPTPPPAAVTTTVAGAVVKGPVAGAQVCAFTVVANGRGTGVGSCTTSDAQGRYSFNLPVGTSPLWVEASGGSYTDEATGATATLPAGSPLTTIITANGGTVDTMLTPLTTLALNAAAATVGSAGTLNAAAYATAAAQLMTAFNLPTAAASNGFNINTTVPAFGANINSYGTALTVISRMVANGTPLTALLATTNPQALAAAYATAAAPPVAPPSTPPPTGGGTITATGSVTSTGGVETFVPRAAAGGTTSAFTTSVAAGTEIYTFYNHVRSVGSSTNAAEVATQAVSATLARGQLSLVFTEIFVNGRTLTRFCTLPCAGFTLVRTTSGSGVTVSFNNASLETSLTGTSLENPPTTPIVLNGSLTGEMPGGYAFTSQLPRATQGSLSLAGTAEPVLFADVGYDGLAPVAERLLFPAVTLTTAQGTLTVSRVAATDPYYFARFVTRVGGESVGLRVTADALVTTASGYTVNLNAATLAGTGPTLRSLVVTAQVSVGKSSGSLAITGEGNFVPQTTLISGNSQAITYDFRAEGGNNGFAFSSISVTLKAGVVAQFTAATPAGKSYTCDSVGSMFMARCAGTVTVGADQRTLSFNGFRAGAQLSPNATIGFDGSLTATGL